jgi:hypothetical protein
VVTFADLNGHVPLVGPGQTCIGLCGNPQAPSCTLDGSPVSCALVNGLSGEGSVVTENGIVITTEGQNGQQDPGKSQQHSSQAQNQAGPLQQLTSTMTVGGSSQNVDVQPPTFVQINFASAEGLAPGKYQVDVTLTKLTTDKDNGQKVKADIESRVDDVQGGGGKIVGQQGPASASAGKIPLIIGISAKNGDFHYTGAANINVTFRGPGGQKATYSFPVNLTQGNQGAASVVGKTRGRTTFTVGSD